MLILGLGTNLGDGLQNLRLAIQSLRKSESIIPVQISPVYTSSALLPPCSVPATWNRPYLNLAVACKTSLLPREVLRIVQRIEKQLGRRQKQYWAPRTIDIDILAWGDNIINQVDLQIPHAGLLERPFALWPLLDLFPEWRHPKQELSDLLHHWGSRFSGFAPFQTKQIPHRLEAGILVGILNVTQDSFSDGGQFTTLPSALTQAEKLFSEGAEILDIGAESTRPGAIPMLPKDEWDLLAPVLSRLKALYKHRSFKPKLSVDTRHYQVAKKAIELGVDWINDVSGFADIKMRKLIAENPVQCVVMHNLGIPANKNKVLLPSSDNLYKQVLNWTEKRFDELLATGVAPKQLIFDVGIGFGKTAQQSWLLLKGIEYFRRLHCLLLVGHSRKSFLNLVTNKPYSERDVETAILSYQLALKKVDYLRVHHVGLSARAVAMATQYDTTVKVSE